MYFDEPEDLAPIAARADIRLALRLNVVLVLALGFFPNVLISICNLVIS